MSWQRVVSRSANRGLGRSRWPLTTIIAVGAAAYFAYLGTWDYALVFLALGAVFGFLTVRSYR